MHQLEAFGIGLHQAVLDAVVHHLHVVAGARTADTQVAVLRRERQEDRLEALADVGFARRPSGSSPPVSPQMPPLVPASTYVIPLAPASVARRTSSWKLVLPPSMIDVAGARALRRAR